MKALTLVLLSALVLQSCGDATSSSESHSTEAKTIVAQVDDLTQQLQKSIGDLTTVVTLDHHRMAQEEGVYTPPSIATLFSDPKINTDLVQANQLAGLDLPFKVLCYAEADTLSARVAYTSAEFIQQRHDFSTDALKDYKSGMDQAISSFQPDQISGTDLSKVVSGYGIVKIKSDFDYETTVQNLRDIVMSQGDTKWFADVDFRKEAAAYNVDLRPTILLLFGGPAPGGKAMMTSPKIGLDAFCQKLLVYQNDNGEVWVAYNDIVAFAELYYGTSTKPQQMINQRLKMTFTKAVTTGDGK